MDEPDYFLEMDYEDRYSIQDGYPIPYNSDGRFINDISDEDDETDFLDEAAFWDDEDD